MSQSPRSPRRESIRKEIELLRQHLHSATDRIDQLREELERTAAEAAFASAAAVFLAEAIGQVDRTGETDIEAAVMVRTRELAQLTLKRLDAQLDHLDPKRGEGFIDWYQHLTIELANALEE